MKIFYSFIVTLMMFLLSGCASYPTEQRSGKDDTASLQFVSQGKYASQLVLVELDGTQFEAQPVKARKARLKGKLYTVATGKRKIVVKNKVGDIIYQKYIMLSSQEVQQIILP